MGGRNVQKPKPLKVYGRSHYACTRCKISKIKCSGEKPACANCKGVNKQDQCVYPTKDRKIVIMESDLNKLHERVEYLESLLNASGTGTSSSIQGLPLTMANPITGSVATTSTSSTTTMAAPIEINISNNVMNGVKLVDFYSPEFDNYSLQYNLLLACQSKLPEKTYALNLLNKVFSTYNQEFYLLDVKEFLQLANDIYDLFDGLQSQQQGRPQSLQSQFDVQQSPRSITQTQICYFFVLLAFGEQLLNVKTDENKYPGMEYYLLAEHLFRLTSSEVDLTFIQCALLLGLYSANLSRYNTVYIYLGVAARAAVAQGYHRQKDIPLNKTPEEKHMLGVHGERAKRLWWTVFVIDTIWATKTVHFQFTDTDVDLPTENVYDLGDAFDSNILEINVHLTKYVAKFVRLIYGPNIRTFSINYINTDQFNQKLLLKNISSSSEDLTKNFEYPLLTQFKNIDYLRSGSRSIANLFLRYHYLITLITKPLLSLILEPTASQFIENFQDVEATISKGIFTSCATIDIVCRLYTSQKIFILGYWDSQHLFTAILMVLIAGINGKRYPQLNRGVALLKYMAEMGNIGARTCFQKLYDINSMLQSSQLQFVLDLSVTINAIVIDEKIDYYSPPVGIVPASSEKKQHQFEARDAIPYLPERYTNTIEGIDTFFDDTKNHLNQESRNFYLSLINQIQGWDD
ncbi:uncharacterized protein J8A68_005210 [[Candida] subhashii]|uniref:Zn(2)-C6 fungal-type domain-containing protein n=1 Tax=[Candida] subhashii TaxID=561895 RepID=A0A8J5QFR7_9ASCO|nr:uncharacterized protein J8A68_005210 [[Candida] subhashii]KAG7661318.1 hypothetical protein J8A68_005210 [[Candida] subhashii]